MRNFTKAFLMLLLCTLSVLTTQAKTEKVHATFASVCLMATSRSTKSWLLTVLLRVEISSVS